MPITYKGRVFRDRYTLMRKIQADHPTWSELRVEAYIDQLEGKGIPRAIKRVEKGRMHVRKETKHNPRRKRK